MLSTFGTMTGIKLRFPFFNAVKPQKIPRLHKSTYIFHRNTENLLCTAQDLYGQELELVWQRYEDGTKWQYSEVINRTRAIAIEEYGEQKDKSGEPAINHAHRVACNAYLLARLVGMTEAQAVTVLCGGYLHDRLESSRDELEFQRRYQQIRETLDFHDKDIANLVLHETRIPLETRYLIYTGNIGARLTDFETDSTVNAQAGIILIKLADTVDNNAERRNRYLQKYRDMAALFRRQEKILDAQEQEEKLTEKLIRRQQYVISQELFELKLDGQIPVEMAVSSFLHRHKEGRKYFAPEYDSALRDGLGMETLAIAKARLAANDVLPAYAA
jgi:hypothetical protein